MKTFKTALLASAFALASTMAFAQTAAGPTGTSAHPKAARDPAPPRAARSALASGPTGASAQPGSWRPRQCGRCGPQDDDGRGRVRVVIQFRKDTARPTAAPLPAPNVK